VHGLGLQNKKLPDAISADGKMAGEKDRVRYGLAKNGLSNRCLSAVFRQINQKIFIASNLTNDLVLLG